MLKIFITIVLSIYLSISISIYSFQLKTINGKNLDLSDFKGKKILIVNTASNSIYASKQYVQLDSLYSLYKDKLVIITVPSNSFGNEPKNNLQLDNYLKDTYNIHFYVTTPMDVTGKNQSPLYKWLTLESQNGNMSNTVKGDFEKYLIDSNGQLIGYFSPAVNPMRDEIRRAIDQ